MSAYAAAGRRTRKPRPAARTTAGHDRARTATATVIGTAIATATATATDHRKEQSP